MCPALDSVPFRDRAAFDGAVDKARAAGAAYHNGDHPLMSDGDYDELVARIAATKTAQPDWGDTGVTTDVAPGVASGTVRHRPPMLSLDKITTHAALAEFIDSVSGSVVVVEAKFDGMACHVEYRHGRLVQAVTRGDGFSGDDITRQVTRDPGISGLPLILPHLWTGAVRGEIYMTSTDFEQANVARVNAGKPPFVNPRNAVAGSIRKIDRAYRVPMSFAAYSITGEELQPLDSHLDQMDYASLLGITTAAMLTAGALPAGTPINGRQPQEVQSVIDGIGEMRPRLGYPIDGAVIKADSRAVRDRLGNHTSAPRWAVAHKFAPDTAHSVLRDIEVSVGRTGRAGFSAVIDPVSVAGTTIRCASVHNVAWIEQQGLGIGSEVAVMRANDVIPQITAIVGERPAGVVPWTPPQTCPQCGQPWEKANQLWRCITPACSLVSLLTYAASRDVLDIDGLGEEIATALVDADLVRDLADLFTLTADEIASASYPRSAGTLDQSVRRIGRATATKLSAGIAAATAQPLSRHITSWGIRMTGRRMGRSLANHFQTLAALRTATVDDLSSVDGVGPEKARLIHAGLRSLAEVIDRLIVAGITTTIEPNSETPKAGPLAGKRVVITGAIEGMNRIDAQEAAERLGATVSGSVSPKTSVLIVGSGSSTRSKLAKAEQLGVATMSAADFVALLGT